MSTVAPLALPTRPMTTEEFLVWEAQEEGRWEFDGIEPLAMTGGVARHQIAVGNLRRALEARVPRGCRVFTETFKLLVPPGDAGEQPVRYPDVMVICKPLRGDDAATDSALILAEVLSPSSVRRDKVQKVEEYARVPGLESYLIVDPAEHTVLLYSRTKLGLEQMGVTDTLRLGDSIHLKVADLFEDVE